MESSESTPFWTNERNSSMAVKTESQAVPPTYNVPSLSSGKSRNCSIAREGGSDSCTGNLLTSRTSTVAALSGEFEGVESVADSFPDFVSFSRDRRMSCSSAESLLSEMNNE